MGSNLVDRLASWKECARSGKPEWLADAAPRIIAELEAEMAARHAPTTGMKAAVAAHRANKPNEPG